MAAYSGQNGKVLTGSTAIAEVTKWTFNPKANVSKWGSSSGSGYKSAVAGTLDGSGSFDYKIDSTSNQYGTSPGIYEGTSHTLKLYFNATEYLSVPCVVESCTYDVDIDNGEVVSGSATFQSNGAWSYSNA